jgi:hypothetical protein
MLLQGGRYKFGLPFRIQTREPNEHDAGVKLVLTEYEFTKVFVGGHEQCTRLATLQKNRTIVDPGIEFRNENEEDFVSIRAEPINNLSIDVLIRDNPHSRAFSVG